MGELSIVLADDHTVVREGLRRVLEDRPGWTVVAEAADAESALRYCRGHRPNVLVLDLNMPGDLTSLELIPLLAQEAPGTRVVVLTMQDEPVFVRGALGAGASAYVLKEAAQSELVAAIEAATDGGTYLNPRLGARLAAAPPTNGDRPDALTRREVEVLGLIAAGHTNTEIADLLCLSVRTVETHRTHIQRKTGRLTRAQLFAYAHAHGLVALPDTDG